MINHPELRNTAEVVGSIVWGFAGLGFMSGWRLVQLNSR